MDEDDLENLIDILINNQPLTSSRIGEFSEAIRINQQITNNIYNIRRYLEDDNLEHYSNTIFNTMFNNIFNNEITHNNDDNQLIDDNERRYNELIDDNEFDDHNERSYNELIDDHNERSYNELIDNNELNELIDDNLYGNNSYNNNNINYNSLVNAINNGDYNTNNNNEITYINNNEANYINTLFNIDFSTDSTVLNRIMQLFLESTNNISNINENVFEDVKVTLTKEQFKKLDTKIILEENTDNKQCNICMDEYKVNDKIITLDCTHIFHRRCIKHWLLLEKVTCPVCRKDVREQLIK